MTSKVKDMTGLRFGKLVVLQRHPENTKEGKARWLCQCDCGNQHIVSGGQLRSGRCRSCGCIHKEAMIEKLSRDLTGMRFGRLTVLQRCSEEDDYVSPNTGRRIHRWLCKCDCGELTKVIAEQLTRGRTKSCGCLRQEKLESGNVVHGHRKDRLYHVWSNMLNRCHNENTPDYYYYGARGIKVCDEWRYDYMAFRKWAYENGYDDTAEKGKCTIDRIDVNGIYEPSNCRWVDMAVQSRNRRNVLNHDKCPRENNDGVGASVS